MSTGPQPRRTRVLFVCMGNICRSPTAAGVFRSMARAAGLEGRVEADSAGTHDYNIGSPPDSRAAAAAARRGYHVPGRARQVQGLDFEAFDLILAMDRGNLALLEAACPQDRRHKLALLMQFAPESGAAEVSDPYGQGPEGFERTLDLIECGVRGVLRHLGAAPQME